jgi:glycosyltransferase 2 family protein
MLSSSSALQPALSKNRIAMKSKYARWLLRLIGPAILVYYALTTDLTKITASFHQFNWWPLLMSLTLYPIYVGFKAWRWNMLMRELGMRAPSLGYSMLVYMIGLFLGSATPGQSGDFIKAWYVCEHGQSLAPALFSILLDRLFDFLIMAVLGLLGVITFLQIFPLQMQGPVLIMTIGFSALIVLIVPVLMARQPRERLMMSAQRLAPRLLRSALERWRNQLAGLDLHLVFIAKLLVATLGSATLTMLRLWLLFYALRIDIPIFALISSVALISILGVLPISFSGIGIRDAILIAVLAIYGYGPETALSVSALFLLVNIEHILLGFLVSLRYPLDQALRSDTTRRFETADLAHE